MVIANQKRNTNIIEYILYMWQVEDLIRANKLNLTALEKKVIDGYQVKRKTKEEIINWYANIITMLKEEKKETNGHLVLLNSLVEELNQLHLYLQQSGKYSHYIELFQKLNTELSELRQKSKANKSDIEICLETLYGIVLLRLQNKPISKQTQEAVEKISAFLSKLAFHFREYESGKLAID